MIKLHILRIIMLIATTIGIRFGGKQYELPMKWLRHFLLGSGGAMEVPTSIVVDAKSAIELAAENGLRKGRALEGKHCLFSSTLYEGRGFYERPTLFYLVGGFTFRLYRDGSISANDYYDWHSTGDGNYYTSPLGKGRAWNLAIKVLGLIFGDDLFVTDGWPMHSQGISNKLWEEMYKVGAKSFHSYFKNVPVFSEEEMERMRAILEWDPEDDYYSYEEEEFPYEEEDYPYEEEDYPYEYSYDDEDEEE